MNSLAYSTYAGGSGDDVGSGIAVDGSGNAYGIGDTKSSDLPTVKAVRPSTPAASTPTSPNSARTGGRCSTALRRGRGDDFGAAIALDSSNNIYAAGYTTSDDILTVNGMQNSLRGGLDGYFAKLDSSGECILYASYFGGPAATSSTP